MSKAAKFAHKAQRAWLELVATNAERDAVAMGMVVDALFANDPHGAIQKVRKYGLPEELVFEIESAFDLTRGGR